MPVSKNKRKNAAVKNRQHKARQARAKKLNSGPVVLASGLKGFNVVLERIRQVAAMYVRVTKAIPGYQETNPDLLPGLQKAIPILQEVTVTRNRLEVELARMHQAGIRDEMEYLNLMQDFESMTIRLGVDFMDEFMPIFDCLEELGEKHKDVDVNLVTETRKQLQEHKPEFKTDIGTTRERSILGQAALPATFEGAVDMTKGGQIGYVGPVDEEATAE